MKQQHLNSFPVFLLMLLTISIVGCSAFNAPPSSDNASQALPFSESKPLVIPVDTVIYVRLKNAIKAANAEAGQDFLALLDEPLSAENQVVAPPGTELTGKVVAARESGHLHTAGYVRIRLSSIVINGKQFPVATNSLISAGGNINNRTLGFLAGGNFLQETGGKKQAGFAPDQRLAFRLTQPLSITSGN